MSLSDVSPAAKGVREIGEQLELGTRNRYRWFIAQDPEVNAFAAPGGVVIVNSGLLGVVGSAEESAGVLAHEVSHIELRHSLKAAIKSLGLCAQWSLALGDYSTTMAGEAATRLTELKFLCEVEARVDLESVKRLAAAGISPSGMPCFFCEACRDGRHEECAPGLTFYTSSVR